MEVPFVRTDDTGNQWFVLFFLLERVQIVQTIQKGTLKRIYKLRMRAIYTVYQVLTLKKLTHHVEKSR